MRRGTGSVVTWRRVIGNPAVNANSTVDHVTTDSLRGLVAPVSGPGPGPAASGTAARSSAMPRNGGSNATGGPVQVARGERQPL
jgi:hypothetical protein